MSLVNIDTSQPALPMFQQARRLRINMERTRRFAMGAPIDLGGGLIFRADVSGEARINITALGAAAAQALAAGSPFSIVFRDAANVSHTLDAAQTAALAQQAMAYVSAVYAASWALKDGTETDITNDANWPG